MTREDGIKWLADTAKIPLADFKLTRPVHFLAQYFLGGSSEHNAERDAFIKANTVVYGTSARGMNMPADADCASDWMLGLARKQVIDSMSAAPVPAPPPVAFVVVPEVDLGLRLPAPPVPTWAPVEVYPHRELVNNDADDHLFEPPPVALPTMAEVAERLTSLRERVDAHVADAEADAEADAQRRFEDRAALNRLSDRLVASEMELGLIDDALDHMHAGQQSPANVVGRLATIIARITAMNL
jgi:hypothetical protein